MKKCKNKSLCICKFEDISKFFLDNFKGQNKEKCVNTQGPSESGRRGAIPSPQILGGIEANPPWITTRPLPPDFPFEFQAFLRPCTHMNMYVM